MLVQVEVSAHRSSKFQYKRADTPSRSDLQGGGDCDGLRQLLPVGPANMRYDS